MDLSNEDRAEARELFRADDGSRICSFCGGIHTRACPRVSSFELYENGKIKQAAFWPNGQWDDSFIIWPEDVFENEAETEPGE